MDAELADLHLEQLEHSEQIHALRAGLAMGLDTQQELAAERERLATLFIHEMAALHKRRWCQHIIDY